MGNMRIINADISANFNDVERKLPRKDNAEIGYFVDDDAGKEHVFFNIFLSKREDDYLSISIELEELLSAIAKVIKEERVE